MDWKKEKDYEYTNDLSPEGWAWEFLRRNPEYIQSYNDFQLVVNELENKYGNRKDNFQKWAEDPKSKVYIPPKSKNESDQQWTYRAMLNHDNPRIINIETYTAQKWELQRMYDPTKSYDKKNKIQFKLNKDYPRVLCRREGLELFSQINKVTFIVPKMVLIFDLSRSIPQQLKIAEKHLKSAQKNKKLKGHFHMDKWPLYLRLLDAYNAGATSKRIRKIIFETVTYANYSEVTSEELAKKLRENKDSANDYSNRYLDILHILKLKDKTSIK